mmetsp:Transcript_51415/g.154425  ORF Transcript_51415/g.154425 Transcript_51415/m.154425 type:complete len:211 (-) Transcript_51415:310-942(-)
MPPGTFLNCADTGVSDPFRYATLFGLPSLSSSPLLPPLVSADIVAEIVRDRDCDADASRPTPISAESSTSDGVQGRTRVPSSSAELLPPGCDELSLLSDCSNTIDIAPPATPPLGSLPPSPSNNSSVLVEDIRSMHPLAGGPSIFSIVFFIPCWPWPWRSLVDKNFGPMVFSMATTSLFTASSTSLLFPRSLNLLRDVAPRVLAWACCPW